MNHSCLICDKYICCKPVNPFSKPVQAYWGEIVVYKFIGKILEKRKYDKKLRKKYFKKNELTMTRTKWKKIFKKLFDASYVINCLLNKIFK